MVHEYAFREKLSRHVAMREEPGIFAFDRLATRVGAGHNPESRTPSPKSPIPKPELRIPTRSRAPSPEARGTDFATMFHKTKHLRCSDIVPFKILMKAKDLQACSYSSQPQKGDRFLRGTLHDVDENKGPEKWNCRFATMLMKTKMVIVLCHDM